MTVPAEEATANYVPAAAVIRKWQALSGFTGRKERVGGFLSWGEILRPNLRPASKTGELEFRRGRWYSMCSGEMRRYMGEHQWRKQSSGRILTLRRESVGSEQD